MKFEDIYNSAVAAACVVAIAVEGKRMYDEIQDQKARDAAEDWKMEAGARLNAMLHHAKKNRISKAGYIQALEAAKNVLSFEVDVALPGNPHAGRTLRALLNSLDNEIATVK